jgi:hypothetical protein
MPLRSIRLRFLALVLVATAAACGAHQGGAMLPSSGFALRGAKATPTPKPTPIPHAACTIRSGFIAPLIGKLDVETAFGQLEETKGIRTAASGVDLGTTRLHHVRAAQTGKVRYYRSIRGYQDAAVITAKDGVQMLYAPLSFAKSPPKNRTIRAGEALGKTGSRTLHFEITDGTDPSDPAGEQLNPCGNADGATGTMSIVPSSSDAIAADVNVAFTTFELDGVEFPTPGPGGIVTMPVAMTVSKVGPLHGWGFGTKQFGVTTGSFNIVLCGNVVFQTGDPRFSTTVPPTGTVTLPHLVFFRDAGSSSNDLSENLPPSFTRACPAPPPVGGSTYNLIMTVGQIAQGDWTTSDASPESMTMTSGSPTIASVSPSPGPVAVLTSPPPYPPNAGQYYAITANATGSTVITNFNITTMATAAPITVTVLPTPTIAPWPTPMPNSIATPVPTPTPTASPTPTPSP